MAQNYKDYLAAQVMSENRIVNYRLLSRALKIHVNTAKEQLYDFHRTQNARKAGSVHATYLLAGVRKVPSAPTTNGVNGSNKQDGEDTVMCDSFMISSSAPQPTQEDTQDESIPTTSITLCREEDLKSVQDNYSELHAAHVYSLEAGPLKNLHVLSECNSRLLADNAEDDPLKTWETYGTIRNPRAQRRATRAQPPVTSAPSAPVTSKTVEKQDVKKAAQAEPAKPSPSEGTGNKSAPATTVKKPPTTKRESSSLFKSFQKAANQPKKPTKDQPMADAPEEGSDSESLPQASSAEAKTKAEAARKDKAEREAKLNAMMDEESEAEPSAGEEDEEMPDAEQEPEPEPEQVPEPAQEEKEENVTMTNGRRRGRRRIMKKKTTKDADGYLVTKEEPAWESFSEDEAPKKPAAKLVASKNSELDEPAAKRAKNAGGQARKGQGNIMSFFGKK